MSPRRRAELTGEANYFGELAAEQHLDGEHDDALISADRAIQAHERLFRADRRDLHVREVLAARYRDRVDIRRELGRLDNQRGRPDAALAGFQAGIQDARRAIDLYQGTEAASQYGLLLPSIRLVLAELLGWTGDHTLARAEADTAIAANRVHTDRDEEQEVLELAHATARYADLLAGLGAHPEALTALREAVELYRPHTGHAGWLWTNRHARGTVWVTTPTLARFCQSAFALARIQEPPHPAAAPEALRALQDAAEGFADLGLNQYALLAYGPAEHRTQMRNLAATVEAIERWLAVLGGDSLTGAYRRALETSLREPSRDGVRSPAFRQLRPSLEAVLSPYPGQP